jgi:hypothetical protein
MVDETMELNDEQREAIAILVDRINDLLPPTFKAMWSEDTMEYEGENVAGGLIVGRADGEEMDEEQDAMVQHLVYEAIGLGVADDLSYEISLDDPENVELVSVAYEPEEKDVMEEIEKWDHRGYE